MNNSLCHCGGFNEECAYCGGSGEIKHKSIEIIKIIPTEKMLADEKRELENYIHKADEKFYESEPTTLNKKKKKER